MHLCLRFLDSAFQLIDIQNEQARAVSGKVVSRWKATMVHKGRILWHVSRRTRLLIDDACAREARCICSAQRQHRHRRP
jgi:hypothetical protein